MTPLPPPLGPGDVVAWRLDLARFGAAWDGGEGAYRAGGRWNSKGIRAVYCAIDPATAILEVANPNWLRPGMPSAGQQAFGDDLLARHEFILIPSAVSSASWNLMFTGTNAAGAYALRSQDRFALDTRLHPPAMP